MSMISSGTRVTHAPIKKCTAMGAGGGGERIVCERSWRAVVLSPATEMLRHSIRVTSFRIYWLSIEHRFVPRLYSSFLSGTPQTNSRTNAGLHVTRNRNRLRRNATFRLMKLAFGR